MREQESDGMFAHFLLAQPAQYFALRCCYPAEAPAFRHDPAAAQHLGAQRTSLSSASRVHRGHSPEAGLCQTDVPPRPPAIRVAFGGYSYS